MKNTTTSAQSGVGLLVLFCLFAQFASAATDGTIGATSTGELEISMTVKDAPESEIQISGLEDFDFGKVAVQQTPTPITISSICVYLSSASTYQLAVTDVNPNPAAFSPLGYLTPDDASAPERQYRYAYVDPDGVTVDTNQPHGGLRGSSNAVCAASDMASLTISPLSITQDVSGVTWTGTMTLTVTPE